MDRVVTRLGAAAAMLGAVIAVVFNLLHPRSGDVGSAAEEVRLATEEGIWRFDHYMLAWTSVLLLFALVVIARSFTREPAASWGRVALPFGIGSTSILLVAIVIDGFAVAEAGELADAAVAEAVAYVAGGIFLALIGSLFGITPIVFGAAVLAGDDYPKWLGWAAVVAGLIGLLAASIIFFDGFSSFTTNVLFPISSLLFTVWVGMMGYMLWQKTAAPVAQVGTQPTA
jgi:hypothetical protein